MWDVRQTVRVVDPASIHHERVGWVAASFASGMHHVQFSEKMSDFGVFRDEQLESAGAPVTEAIRRSEIQCALEGDCSPTTWNKDHLDVFLSLIGNCKEAG